MGIELLITRYEITYEYSQGGLRSIDDIQQVSADTADKIIKNGRKSILAMKAIGEDMRETRKRHGVEKWDFCVNVHIRNKAGLPLEEIQRIAKLLGKQADEVTY